MGGTEKQKRGDEPRYSFPSDLFPFYTRRLTWDFPSEGTLKNAVNQLHFEHLETTTITKIRQQQRQQQFDEA